MEMEDLNPNPTLEQRIDLFFSVIGIAMFQNKKISPMTIKGKD